MTRQCISWMAALGVVLAFMIAAQAGTYTSDFDQYLSLNQSKDQVTAIITMADRVDLEALKAELSARKADRQEWHEAVVRALQDKATESQANFLAKLDEMQKQGQVTSYKSLWLGNIVIVTATQSAYDELVQRADVDQIAPDYAIESIKDMEGTTPTITSGVESGLEAIRADECWAMGYTGEGRLVSHLDTGVAGSHVALASRWRGLDSRYANDPEWAWYDPVTETTFPFDSGYHGTHTMGTICGLGESTGDTIGVAFGAEWISAGVIDRVSIEQTLSDAITAFQWIADPDEDASTVWDVPDVCSNSWGVNSSMGYPACDETLWDAIDCAEAAGVVVVFAAGNEGSSSQTLRSPSDRATTDLSTFAIGAVDGNDEDLPIASFSSRGPSYCTEDGSETIKPEVSAPGVDVRSAYSYGGYTTLSGTSMATPHVAGVVALMRQANANLSVDQIKQILLDTAVDHGDTGEDNDYGMGVIDAYEAVTRALAYLDGWGTLAGTITDQATGDPIQGATVSVVDHDWSARSRSNGMFYLFMPADTAYSIKVDYSPTHLPIYDTVTVAENETTIVNYALEGKVTATFTVSFGNGSEISYRDFYMKGSWDNDGFYDADWSADLITLTDDGVSPDQTAGDGIFTATALLARDLNNTYSWKVYTENYGVSSIDDAFLASGSDFDIDDLDPVTVPTLAPNPSGSNNNFEFSVEGDNGLSLDLAAGINSAAYKWGASTYLLANTTYSFIFHVMDGQEAVYGSGGVGGAELSYTPTLEGAYDFIFNDNNDSYIVQLTGTEGVPMYPGATSGLDGHVPTSWMPPGTTLSTELGYDDGTLTNAWMFNASENLIAVMFAPESYPVEIDSVMLHVLTEGDEYWPSFDNSNDPVGVSVYLDNGSGYPEDDPVFYTVTTAEVGDWIRVDIDQIAVESGYFWVAINYVDGEAYDYIGIDAATDYPANQWYLLDGTWYSGGAYIYTGDNMIRAKVFSEGASTWLAYDDGIPAKEITAPMVAPNISGKAVGTGVAAKAVPASSNPILPSPIAYHPIIMSNPPLITETEVLAGYHLYRSTTSGPYDQGLRINSEMLTAASYDDWGTDTYGPIVNGTTYYYQVSAVYEVGGSYVEVGPSEEFTGTPTNHAPAAPVNLLGDVSDHTVTLTWDANTDYDIAAYNVYRRDYNAQVFNLVGTVDHPAATYTEDISVDGIYRYKVKAVDAEGMESASFSNYVDLGVGLIPPGVITASTDQEFQIELKWRAPGSSSLITETENLNVAVVIADYSGDESEVMDYLIDNGAVEEYTAFDAANDSPELSDLEPFDMVFVWSNYAFYDAEGLGDVLADYVDLGKPVIALNFCFYNGGPIGGRFMSDYSPLGSSYTGFVAANLGEYDASSPLMDGVTTLYDYYIMNAPVQNNGEAAAYWDNGYPLIVSSPDYPIVAINAYVGATYRQWDGDMLQLVYNAVNYVGSTGIDPDGYKLYKSDSESGEFELLGTFAGDVRTYIDSPVPNAVSYYYQVTAIWDDEESAPSNTAEGYGMNYVPETPTTLTASVDDHTVSLTWAFTDLMGDFDHYNVYRKISGDTDFSLIGTSAGESYTDEITGEDAVYIYCVTAVDNGDPQLESENSNSAFAPVGNLPPNNLTATGNQDGVVPLNWSEPGILPCTTLVYDNGECTLGLYFNSYDNLFAKQFIGSAPIQICTVFVHIYTEGDDSWPWPDSQHDPSLVQIWDDDGTGQPGSVIGEVTQTCELGEMLTIGFESPIVCNTNNFWVSWTYTDEGVDGLGFASTGDYLEYAWYRMDGTWYNSYVDPYPYDSIIRASITIDGVAELLTENDPVSKSVTSDLNDDDPQLYDTAEMLGYYIYRSTSSDVPIDDDYRITPSYVTDTQYDDENVTNGTTYYYIAVAVYNNSGVIEYSSASNEVSATPRNPGQFAVNPTSLTVSGVEGDTAVSEQLTLTNNGGLPVTYSVFASVDSRVAVNGQHHVSGVTSSLFSAINTVYDKSNVTPEVSNPPVITDNGGPDDFGYTWVDSDEDNGPDYNWVDITGDGEQITFGGDDSNIGPYEIGFDFPFYGETFSTFRVCSNGWLSFTSSNTYYYNYELPYDDDEYSAPYDAIAPYWDDLNPNYGGEFYYRSSSDSLVMSWIDIPTYSDGYYLTFQIILTSNGTITLQYANMEDDGSSATVGIQNADGSDGLTISYDSSYLHEDMAIRIKAGWLSADPASGTIPAGGSVTIDAVCDPSTLAAGTYTGNLAFSAYDMNHDLDGVDVPVEFDVAINTGIDDDNTAVLPTTFSLDQNYPNPFNAHTEIKYALPVDSDVKLEVYNVLGQKVVTLVDEEQVAGYHSLIWDGTNTSGQVVSSGMYLYKLVTSEDTFVKKMVMLK